MRNKIFIIIIVLFLAGANIYQFFYAKNLRISLSKEVPSDVLKMVEPVNTSNPENPQASLPLNEKDVPKDAIRLSVSLNGFEPKEFSVKSGQKVILALKAVDSVHVFKFKNEKLSKVKIGIASGETKTIQFYAPKEKGDYEFFCDVPGHNEVGKMIVK